MSKSEKEESLSVHVELSSLFKFIKPYNGDKQTLNAFISNCNNAYELASVEQKPILFKYMLSQLQGKAEIASSIKNFTSWDQLKSFLKSQFSDIKHYSHLLAELQDSKQNPNEAVSQFGLRIEEILSQLLTEIVLTKAKETPGRTAAMEDLALHHFLIGLTPRVSNIVRCKSPKNLNEAINFAISEEKIQKLMYKRNAPSVSLPNPQRRNNEYFKSTNINNVKTQGQPDKICRYCKNVGHLIEECRKREYNNNRAKALQNNARYNNPFPNISRYPNRQQSRIHNVNEDINPSPLYDRGQDVQNEHLNE